MNSTTRIWQIWQIGDSAFPLGGFAHSSGLEATLQQGEVQNLEELETFIDASLWQAGYSSLPLVNDAHARSKSLTELDDLCDIFLSNPVANRASRVQGRAFFTACLRSFSNEKFDQLDDQFKREQSLRHFTPVFGSCLSLLEIDLETSQKLFFHITLRGILSAAVRLGIIGPYQSQKLQFGRSEFLGKVLTRCRALKSSELAQTSPLIDLFQSNHERLYSKLFQS